MTTDKTRRALPLLRFLRSRNRSLCLFCSFPALLSSCLLSAQTLVSSALYFFPLLAVAECMMLGRLGRLRTMLNSHSACVRDVVEEGNCHLSIWIGNNKKIASSFLRARKLYSGWAEASKTSGDVGTDRRLCPAVAIRLNGTIRRASHQSPGKVFAM
jgi:hypothetical protein